MQAAGPGVGHVGLNGGDLQPAHEGLGGGPATLHAEGHHAAGAVGQVLPGPLVVGVALQSGVAHPAHLGVSLQEPPQPDVEALHT